MNNLTPAFIDHLRFNEDGLIPSVSQDWLDGAVLMLAWMNRASLEKTIKTGQVHYWSRSRKSLWHKGATSGHTQILKGIRYDCDADVILLSIEQTGEIACHTGARSCFYQTDTLPSQGGENALNPPMDACSELFNVIHKRKTTPEEGSYTNHLLDNGDNHILKKIGEESAEFVMACKDNNQNQIANEAADILYHLQVALVHHEVEWKEVLKVLANRRDAPRRN